MSPAGVQGSTPRRSKGHPKKHLPLFDHLLLPLPFHKLPVIEAISLNSLSANANEFSVMFDVCYAADKLSPRRRFHPAKVHLKALLSSPAAAAAHADISMDQSDGLASAVCLDLLFWPSLTLIEIA